MTKLFPATATTWANRTPGCVAHGDAYTRDMIVVMAT